MASEALSIDGLVGDLRRLGVASGDVVMVHASLCALGPVDGGTVGVVAALDRAVGPDGTLLMVLGARNDWSDVNQRPEAEREHLLDDAVAFDPLTTPADPDVGVLAEVFRQQPGTVVNHHPEARFAARGRIAGALIDDPPFDDYFGPGSPLHRFAEASGKVLRLGADLDTVTLIHYAEYLADVPEKRRVVRHRKVWLDNRSQILRIECLDDSDGIADYDGDEDYFAVLLREYLAGGRARTGRVGGAQSELIDSVDLLEFATAWLNREFGQG